MSYFSLMITVATEIEIGRTAADVWAVVADYSRDPEWRRGVERMEPSGPLRVGTTTDERMRFAGRTYRNAGVVEMVGPGTTFAWRTTAGVEAAGRRTVEETGPDRCRVRLLTQVRPSGAERVLAPVLRLMLQRNLTGDARRLAALAEDRIRTSR
jgi:hypothetical protein